MNNTQLYLALGIPTLAIITSLIISLIQVSGIREDGREIRKEFADLRRDVNATMADMRREAREDRLQIDSDIKLLTGKLFELMGRQ
jgi:hypothetical protein